MKEKIPFEIREAVGRIVWATARRTGRYWVYKGSLLAWVGGLPNVAGAGKRHSGAGGEA